ncbi:hypothetical protein D9611_015099 [Ephemerocybe angulata]|uniref:Helicase C-terminal domain-containing protein n=1 Tax=Ephemerocybe angulata TaxID=980116 RepID=A0A8H5ER53_9AGAR|nr:hypothetical protein D9611_015099 [Tulosesus angulatus]
MPTHTAHSALVKFWFALEGAPWGYPTWQDITGLEAGIFPEDSSHRPRGWSEQDVAHIKSYFEEYKAKRTEDEKIKFAGLTRKVGKDVVPGRALWRTFVTENYSRSWNIHGRISKVLNDVRIHPMQLMSSLGDFDEYPGAISYLPMALDHIALALFGQESFDKSGHLQRELRDPTLILAQRTWEHLRRAHGRDYARLEKLEGIMQKALQALHNNKPTKKKLTSLIRNAGKWQALALSYNSEAMLMKIEDIRAELEQLLEGLGQHVPVRARKPKKELTLITKQALQALASHEDVSDLGHLYDTYFSDDAVDDSIARERHCGGEVKFAEPVSGADHGVEIEAGMTPEQKRYNLGFHNGLPLMFNDKRHDMGITLWEYKACHEDGKADAMLENLTLHEHQIDGIHAIVRKIFTTEPSTREYTGILIADGVGLGKTLQAIGVIAFLVDVATRQLMSHPIPPIIREQPYLVTHNPIPSRPILILVPGTLIAQWLHELKIAIKPRFIDILLYGSGAIQHKAFWAQGGPYESSKHPPHRRVILASHSALYQDSASLYTSPVTIQSTPWQAPEKLPGYEKCKPDTLFSKEYLAIVFDESQDVRNPGPRQSAVLSIMEQALDLAAMGRIAGIPYFFSEEMIEQDRQYAADLRRSKSEKKDYQGSEDDCPLRRCQEEISSRTYAKFDGFVIRRTSESKGRNGCPLVDLPKLDIIHGFIQLTERELDILESRTEESLDAASTGNGRGVSSSRFYIEHRMGVTFAQADPDAPLPKFDSLDEWEPVKSTKVDICAQIVRHLLSRDDAPRVEFVDGSPVFPPMPSIDIASPPTTKNKIVIYQEFPSYRPVLENVLRLYGVDSLAFDGRMTYERRSEVIARFKTDPLCRVLLFSRVGNVGLNLTCANTVIFMDQPWSAQDEGQIRGRIHRQGQTLPCTSYQLLALDTADPILAQISESKSHMLKAFFSRETSQKLNAVLHGHVLASDDCEETKSNSTGGVSPPSDEKPKVKPRPKPRKKEKNHLPIPESSTAVLTSPLVLNHEHPTKIGELNDLEGSKPADREDSGKTDHLGPLKSISPPPPPAKDVDDSRMVAGDKERQTEGVAHHSVKAADDLAPYFSHGHDEAIETQVDNQGDHLLRGDNQSSEDFTIQSSPHSLFSDEELASEEVSEPENPPHKLQINSENYPPAKLKSDTAGFTQTALPLSKTPQKLKTTRAVDSEYVNLDELDDITTVPGMGEVIVTPLNTGRTPGPILRNGCAVNIGKRGRSSIIQEDGEASDDPSSPTNQIAAYKRLKSDLNGPPAVNLPKGNNNTTYMGSSHRRPIAHLPTNPQPLSTLSKGKWKATLQDDGENQRRKYSAPSHRIPTVFKPSGSTKSRGLPENPLSAKNTNPFGSARK